MRLALKRFTVSGSDPRRGWLSRTPRGATWMTGNETQTEIVQLGLIFDDSADDERSSALLSCCFKMRFTAAFFAILAADLASASGMFLFLS